MERYAAKILFQFRVVIAGESSKRRICEEKIIILFAKNAQDALEKINEIGVQSEHNYINDDHKMVYYEFVGILDLMHLGIECDQNEVWYEIKEYLTPMERKAKIIPDIDQLSAFKNEHKSKT